MGRFSCALVLVCGCGARTELDVPAVHDAGSPPPTPCDARDYTATAADWSSFQLAAGHLYFQTGYGALARVDTESGVLEPLDMDVVNGFAVDDTYVWWVGKGGLLAHESNGGGDVSYGPCAAPNTCPGGPGYSSTIIGLTEDVVVTADPQNILYVLPKSGGGPTPLVPNVAPTAVVMAFVHDGPRVFWMTDEYVFEAIIGASAKPDIDEGWPTGLALHDQDVYWTSSINHDPRLVHRATQGGDTTVLYSGDMHAPLGANATHVYGVMPGGIGRVSVSSGETTIIAPNVSPLKMIVDGACVYTLEKQGHIRRMPG